MMPLLMAQGTPIVSGRVHHASIVADEQGCVVHAAQSETIWFRDECIRRETLIGGEVTSVWCTAGGEHWFSYPAAGRLQAGHYPADPAAPTTYPEQVRAVFARTIAHHRLVGRGEVAGRPVKVFAWHEPWRLEGCIATSAHRITCNVLESPEFPLIVRSSVDHGTTRTIRDAYLDLEAEVPPDLFRLPADLALIQPWVDPPGAFVFEWRRTSSQGEATGFIEARAVVDPEGGSCLTTTSILYPQGVDHSDQPVLMTEVTGDRQAALQQLRQALQFHSWDDMKRIGTGEVAGLPTEVLASLTLKTTVEICDHPQLGTIRVREVDAQGNITEALVTLEIE